jgi:hydroxylysine kinase
MMSHDRVTVPNPSRRPATPRTSTLDGSDLSASFVAMAVDEAAQIAKSHYGIQGAISRLRTEKDDTFRIDGSTGRFILKVANPAAILAEIALQDALTAHVAAKDPSLSVPQTIPDRTGRLRPHVVDLAGQGRYVRLLTYLDGVPLDSTYSLSSERERVGRALGRLRLATAGFSHPCDARTFPWDVRHLLSLEPLLEHINSSRHRIQLSMALNRFRLIRPKVADLRSQVLHNDFSKSNILVDHRSPEFVVGIIDFGDAVRTAIAIDVSTAVLNQLPGTVTGIRGRDFFGDARDVLQGYLSVADLHEEELRMIPHLVMARIVARALITRYRAKLLQSNADYILRNTEQGWTQLDWFLDRTPQEVSNVLLEFSGSSRRGLDKGQHHDA